MADTTVHAVANYFIRRSYEDESGDSMTHLRLQKLVFFAQAWYLGINGTALFDEDFEAWVHGPVCRQLYAAIREQGCKNWEPITQSYSEEPNEEHILSYLDEVWDAYSKYSAKGLEAMTHNDAPWRTAREGLQPGDPSNRIIEKPLIAATYQDYLSKDGTE